MSDGASYGVQPTRALKTIISGEPNPDDEELQSVIEMRDSILATPIADPWNESFKHGTEESGDAYDTACRAVAHAFLNEFMLRPKSASLPLDDLYTQVKNNYEEGSNEHELFNGLTGFMVGWAFNAARRCVELEPAPNPAIVTINDES